MPVPESRLHSSLQSQWTSDGLNAYAWPGGYPIWYIDGHGNCLCPACATLEVMRDPDDDKDLPATSDINWEDSSLYCDICAERIESAYAD